MEYGKVCVRNFTGLSVAIFFAGCTTIGNDIGGAKDIDGDDFDQRLAGFTEKALINEPKSVGRDGAILVATKRCKAADRRRLDQLFPISEARMVASEQVNAPYGLPLVEEINDNEAFLYQDEHIILYNSALKLPMFATYRLRASDIDSGDRLECFRVDPRLEPSARSKTIDYHGSTDLDKGHLVPDADMQRSKDTVMNTYYMSNMMPQFGSVNSGSWSYIEAATRLWASELGEVYVVSGSIFDLDGDAVRDDDADAERAPPTGSVALPTGFYKIILHALDDGSFRAISFILPHIQTSTAPNPDYVPTKITSIDEIEVVTGMDFFPNMPTAQQDSLEASVESDLWCRRECDGIL